MNFQAYFRKFNCVHVCTERRMLKSITYLHRFSYMLAIHSLQSIERSSIFRPQQGESQDYYRPRQCRPCRLVHIVNRDVITGFGSKTNGWGTFGEVVGIISSPLPQYCWGLCYSIDCHVWINLTLATRWFYHWPCMCRKRWRCPDWLCSQQWRCMQATC